MCPFFKRVVAALGGLILQREQADNSVEAAFGKVWLSMAACIQAAPPPARASNRQVCKAINRTE